MSTKEGLQLYTVEVDFRETYELIASVYAYVGTRHHRLMDLGPAWVRKVRGQLSAGFAARLGKFSEQEIDELLCLAQLLAWRSPTGREVRPFLAWCSTLSSGDLYELVAAAYMAGYGIPANLAEMRDNAVDLLGGWDEEYFSRLDPAVPAALRSSAQSVQERLGGADPQSLIEEFTNGVVVVPSTEVSTIILGPQYHLRPWNLISPYKGTTFVLFPLETAVPEPGEPHPKLVRAVKALSDAGRLRILRFLREQPRVFTEVVTELGLANSTINYHLGLLRAAGLVRVFSDATGRGPMQYALRQPALAETLAGVAEYIGQDTKGD